jgi:hypothetical protein
MLSFPRSWVLRSTIGHWSNSANARGSRSSGLDPAHFFPTLDAAVDAFRRETGADPTWTMNASG